MIQINRESNTIIKDCSNKELLKEKLREFYFKRRPLNLREVQVISRNNVLYEGVVDPKSLFRHEVMGEKGLLHR